ncbi:MAG: SulP family inorganic anion transporter [Candidatus Limnocylindria bacterium]
MRRIGLPPGAAMLVAYERPWLRADVLAGVTVAAYLVPQVMAYAQLAGLDPVVGLWAAILPALVYGLLTTSRHISIGPESTTAVMVIASVGPLAAGDPARFATLAAALAIMVGLVSLIAGLLRLGFLGDLLSKPILVGYMAGVALIMVISQLGRLTGIDIRAEGMAAIVGEAAGRLDEAHLPTLVLGLGVVAFLVIARWRLRPLPGPLVAVVGATAIVALLGLEGQGVTVVGDIPSGLPPIGLPLIELGDVPRLAASAVGVAVVAYTDVILTGRSFAQRRGYAIDADAELMALGGANVAAGLTGGMPVSSSGSRTAIGDSVGGRTQLVGMVAGGSVVVVLLALGDLLAGFPTAALGGLVVFAGLRLIDVAGLRRLARFRPSELALALSATAGVLVAGVLVGILIAIALSVMDLFARVARPSAAILGRAPGVAGLHDITDYPDAVTIPGLVVFRYDAPLCFANASDFKARALAAALHQPTPVEWLLLNAEANVEVDLTAADALGELHDELERRGIVLALARVKHDLREQLERIGLITHIGPERIYATLPVALEAFAARHGTPAAPTEPVAPSDGGPSAPAR